MFEPTIRGADQEVAFQRPVLHRYQNQSAPQRLILARHKRCALALVLSLLVPSLSGCVTTYRGALEPISIVSPQRVSSRETRTIPLNIAVLRNKSLPGRPFTARGGGHGVEINFEESLTRLLVQHLSDVFSSVRLIEWPTDTRAGEPVLQYDMGYREIGRDLSEGRYLFESYLTVELKDWRLTTTFSKHAHVERVEYHMPDIARTNAYLELFTLGLIAPITSQITTQAIGKEALRLLERTLMISVSGIREKLSADRAVLAYATGQQTVSDDQQETRAAGDPRPVSVGPESPTPGDASGLRAKHPPSKYDDFLNSVVVVRTSKGVGSGFFVSPKGLMVTSYHVIAGEQTVAVKLRGGTVRLGTVVASKPEWDLALVSVPADGSPWLELAKAEESSVGLDIIAIGTPEGLSWTLSKGIISAIRDVDDIRLVQTDAPLNRGNSGGPLILADSGRVVGVAAFGLKKAGTEGLNFAVSAANVAAAFASYLTKPPPAKP